MTELVDRFREGSVAVLALVTSGGTLICCALPIVLVSLGFGTVVAGITGDFPWLVALSRHKEWVFAGSAAVLTLGGWLIYHRARACPADPRIRRACLLLDKWNRRLYWTSVAVWVIGFFAAYLLLPLSLYFGLA